MQNESNLPKPDLGNNPMERLLGEEDVSLGRELVDNLRREEIGVAVYLDNKPYKKSIIIQNQLDTAKLSEEIQEGDKQLLGLIVPTDKENQFAFLGISENSLILTLNKYWDKFNDFKGNNGTFLNLKEFWVNNFGTLITDASDRKMVTVDITDREQPEEFHRIFMDSVKRERQKIQEVKAKRAELRKKILQELYPQEPQT